MQVGGRETKQATQLSVVLVQITFSSPINACLTGKTLLRNQQTKHIHMTIRPDITQLWKENE